MNKVVKLFYFYILSAIITWFGLYSLIGIQLKDGNIFVNVISPLIIAGILLGVSELISIRGGKLKQTFYRVLEILKYVGIITVFLVFIIGFIGGFGILELLDSWYLLVIGAVVWGIAIIVSIKEKKTL